MSAVFAAINRNKRGIALDLQKPEGARILRELAARSDVLVENFVPGVADRLGVGYQAVSGVNPGLVYVSVSGFGQTGSLRPAPGLQHDRPGHGRAHGHHGDAGPPADAGGRVDRRRGGGLPRLRRHQRRAACTGCAPAAGSTST